MHFRVYWSCTANIRVSGQIPIITTATLTTLGEHGSVSVKQLLFNPWASNPCTEAASTNTVLATPSASNNSIYALEYSLSIPQSITSKGELPNSTIMVGEFML